MSASSIDTPEVEHVDNLNEWPGLEGLPAEL